MGGWRDRFTDDDDVAPLRFRRDVLLRLTLDGAAAVADHARGRGLSRQEWVRRAIVEQMWREGAVSVPVMSPYSGESVLRRPPHLQGGS